VDAFEAYLDSGAAIDPYLADQLLIPLTLAASPSLLHTARITQHLLTNASVIQRFLRVEILIRGELGQPGFVEIVPDQGLTTARGLFTR
jgi:RNA 3'-terminal phosphate cyclase (ATP)